MYAGRVDRFPLNAIIKDKLRNMAEKAIFR